MGGTHEASVFSATSDGRMAVNDDLRPKMLASIADLFAPRELWPYVIAELIIEIHWAAG